MSLVLSRPFWFEVCDGQTCKMDAYIIPQTWKYQRSSENADYKLDSFVYMFYIFTRLQKVDCPVNKNNGIKRKQLRGLWSRVLLAILTDFVKSFSEITRHDLMAMWRTGALFVITSVTKAFSSMFDILVSLGRKMSFVTCFQNWNLRCDLWQEFRHNDDISVSVSCNTSNSSLPIMPHICVSG